MELEILCGFSLFYILMIVIDGYDIYSMTDQLFTIVDTSIRHYMMVLIDFVISLLMLYVKKVNIYRVSIGSIGLSFTLFVFASPARIWNCSHAFFTVPLLSISSVWRPTSNQ